MSHAKSPSDHSQVAKPALDFNCGWSVVNLLSALTLRENALDAPKVRQEISDPFRGRGNAQVGRVAERQSEYS